MLSPSAIQRMFQYLAPRYDLWNRLASCYLDEYWRRTAVSLIPPGSRVLDLCTGTGELIVKMLPSLGAKGQVVGLDFAANMLAVASQKTHSLLQSTPAAAAYVLGDAAALPFPTPAVFLAAPAGNFITGQTIVIDGGGMVGRGG